MHNIYIVVADNTVVRTMYTVWVIEYAVYYQQLVWIIEPQYICDSKYIVNELCVCYTSL